MANNLEVATLAAGCFWCTEAIFQRLKGVESVTSGYTGGTGPDPSYLKVAYGRSDHAESIQIRFDPAVIPYEKILEVFWKTHDPTTPDQQGNDIGPQYRSMILYHNEQQRQAAEASKKQAENTFDDQIITEIVPFQNFYTAEEYHQNFYNSNPKNGYCQLVIDPKIEKLYKDFKDDVKAEP